MKIAILGNGFLGQEFKRQGFDVFSRDEIEIRNPTHTWTYEWEQLKKYDVLINCIGKSNTRWCEDKNNFEELMHINGYLPGILSEFCKENNMKFVHISTGCLYDDWQHPCKETDFIVSHCKYTLAKWVGEIHCNPETDLIIRPRLYFSDVAHDNNLLCKMKNFDEFIYLPNSVTSTSTIVEAVAALLVQDQVGIFNVANDNPITIYDLANHLGLEGTPMSAEKLHETQNLYLVNNVMDISKLKQFYQPRDTLEITKDFFSKI
jgi:dTDP-4-dehydrorhamnose reductase